MSNEFINSLERSPIVAAVKDEEGLALSLKAEVEIVFILYGDICSIPDIVRRIKQSGKMAMVHIDLITGLASKEVSLDFIKQNTDADGIITTKGNLIPHARKLGFYTVLRFFLLDSMAILNIEKQSLSHTTQPDVIEFLPGAVVPKLIGKINRINRVPTMAGGLIVDKDDVMNALNNGAIAISTTNRDVWFM